MGHNPQGGMKTTTDRGGMSRAADGSALPCWSAITGESLAGRDKEQVHPNLAVSAWVFHSFICPLLGLYERNLGNHWLVAKWNKTVASLFNSHDDKTPNSLPRAGERALGGSIPVMLLVFSVRAGVCHLLALSLWQHRVTELIFPLNRLRDQWRISL